LVVETLEIGDYCSKPGQRKASGGFVPKGLLKANQIDDLILVFVVESANTTSSKALRA
jgi:hypothetical protein